MKNGFTLIELLVVVLIIGILAAVALPQYEKAVEKSRAAEALVLLKSIADANRAFYMANGSYADHMDDLDIDIPGTDAMQDSWRRKEGKNFRFGTRAVSYPTSIALANRLPFGQVYYLYVMPDVAGTFCVGYNAKGVAICKSLSNGAKEGSTYIIRG